MKLIEGTVTGFDDEILCEILSRLPLKSLVRFKCVRKSWQSLIETDQWLIDLHHLRTTPRLLMMPFLPEFNSSKDLVESESYCETEHLVKFESYSTADLCLDTCKDRITTTITVQAISNKDLLVCKQALKPINGMICLIDKAEVKDRYDKIKEDHAACLYNVITREATPWIKSTYLEEVEQWCDLSEVNVSRSYEIGFDTATKEYKVICMWQISGWNLEKNQGYGEYTFHEVDHIGILGYYRMCEILTLGKDTAWRRIDKDVPPSKLSFTSVYANGSMYWVNDHRLVAFDVGSEQYRVVSSDLDFIGHRCEYFRLMEFDGHLAIVKNLVDRAINLWILDDDDCDRNIKWTREIIRWSFPHIWLHTIHGTNHFILECYANSAVGDTWKPVFIRSYNRKEKTFSRIKITVDGKRPSWLHFYIDHPLHMFTTYAESLLTLQSSHRPAPDRSSTKRGRQLSYDS